MSREHFDSIIIGSGAGGAAAAYRLTLAGKTVLLLEKGPPIARHDSTLDPAVVVHEGRFKSREKWQDGTGRTIVPEEYFNLGGKTKWYGAALMRCAAHEMQADADFDCLPWPIASTELNSYYAEAGRLLGVRRFPCEADLAAVVAALERRGGWTAMPLPMGLAGNILDFPQEAQHFDGFASPRGLKADAEVALLDKVRQQQNLTIKTAVAVTALLPASDDPTRITGVRAGDAEYRADNVLLAAGALHSPRLLTRYLAQHALERLPINANVGRNLKLHLLTAMIALSTSRKTDLLRKTTALTHHALAHSSVQPLGFDSELIASLMPRLVPRVMARRMSQHAYGYFLQTEDGSHRDNRVGVAADGTPILDYDARRCPAAVREHHQLIWKLRRDLLAAGQISFAQRIGITGTAHACGTLVAGSNPASSVVDADGRVHGLKGLYVVDGSVLPRSSRVNPSLTIFAWSLRVAERLATKRAEAA